MGSGDVKYKLYSVLTPPADGMRDMPFSLENVSRVIGGGAGSVSTVFGCEKGLRLEGGVRLVESGGVPYLVITAEDGERYAVELSKWEPKRV